MSSDASPDDLSANPFAAPLTETTREDEAGGLGGDQNVRLKYRDQERAVKNVGFFFMVISVFSSILLLVTIQDIINVIQGTRDSPLAMEVFMGVLFMVMGPLQLWIGWNLRRLEPFSWLPAVLISVACLFAFPIGTIAYGIVLYRIAGKSGRFILSNEYHRMVYQN